MKNSISGHTVTMPLEDYNDTRKQIERLLQKSVDRHVYITPIDGQDLRDRSKPKTYKVVINTDSLLKELRVDIEKVVEVELMNRGGEDA